MNTLKTNIIYSTTGRGLHVVKNGRLGHICASLDIEKGGGLHMIVGLVSLIQAVCQNPFSLDT